METTDAVRLNGSSWVIPGPTNIGVLETQDGVYLIDSGNDREAGRKINRLLAGKGWKLLGILNTHSNADHIGANDYFQRMTGCRIFATQAEKSFIESPQIEASFLWGGYTPSDLKNKFFEAKPSKVTDVISGGTDILDGVKVIGLPGHYYQMVGFLTNDRVAYLGDAMFGTHVLQKYKIPYIYDVAAYRETIEKTRALEADYYVLSHGQVETSIGKTADENRDTVNRIEAHLLDILAEKKTFEEIFGSLCTRMEIRLDVGQYALTGNTVRSFLSYLYNKDEIQYEFVNNRMYWILR